MNWRIFSENLRNREVKAVVFDKKKKILILAVTHGDMYKGFLKKLRKYCANIQCEKRLIIMQNDLPDLLTQKTDDWIFKMGGDNSVYEFSAWQKAIESDIAREYNPDVYFFVTSAFIKKRFYAMPIMTDMIVNMVAENKIFGGNVRQFPFQVKYNGLTLNPYLSTHCVVANADIVRKLGTVISKRDHKDFIKPKDSTGIFAENEMWSPQLKVYVSASLTHKYHKKGIQLSPKYYEFFRRKLLCIANEMLLTGRVGELGYKVSDLTPFPRFCNSPLTFFVFGTTVRPFQFMRKAVLQMLYVLFCNKLAKRIGLEKMFMRKCASSVVSTLREGERG